MEQVCSRRITRSGGAAKSRKWQTITIADDERQRLLKSYRVTRCDILRHGEWTSLDTVPSEPVLVICSANPDGRRASVAENIQHDSHLLRALIALSLRPIRARGRGPESVEEGWIIPHQPERSLALIRNFSQLAGIIISDRWRTILWTDGIETRLDDDCCTAPEVPTIPPGEQTNAGAQTLP